MPVLLSEFCDSHHYTVISADQSSILLVNKEGDVKLFVPTPSYQFPMFYAPLGNKIQGYSMAGRAIA